MTRKRPSPTDTPALPAAPPTATAPRRRRPLGRRVAFLIAAVGIGLLLLEGLANIVWLIVDWNTPGEEAEVVVALKEDSHCQYDDELGWVNIPGTHIADFYAPGRDITITDAGVRGGRPIALPKPEGVFRWVCLGDSFTLGYGVGDDETFPFLLGEKHPTLETVNMGQGGYSVGQCGLWYRRLADQIDADAVVLAIIVGDIQRLEIQRTVNGYATPQFSFDRDDHVQVSGVPVPPKLEEGQTLLDRKQRWEYLAAHSGLFRTVSGLTDRFLSDEPNRTAMFVLGFEIILELGRFCRERNQSMAVVLLPTLQEFQDPDLESVHAGCARALSRATQDDAVPFLDLWPAFANAGDPKDLFLDEEFHHYSPEGNALVAAELDRWLPMMFAGFPSDQ